MLQKSKILHYFVAVSFVFLAISVTASGEDWPAITPEEQALKEVTQQPGAPAVILDREETYDDRQQAHTIVIYVRTKVLTEAGRDLANVRVPYSHFNTGVTNVTGRTIHADGSVIPFDGKSFDVTLIRGRGVRYKVRSFTLPDVQVGSIFEYRFSIRYADQWLTNPRWIVQEGLFQKKVSFKFFPTPGFVVLRNGRIGKGNGWTNYLPKPYEPQVKDNPLEHWIELKMTDVPAFVEEPLMPPADMQKWRVAFYYQIGDTKPDQYWRDEGKEWNKQVENFMGPKGDVDSVLSEITTPSDSPNVKARKIYAYIAKMENRSYIPSRSGQEEKILELKPNSSAADVLRQKSGYHDDLTRLYVAMVRAAGIPAWLMWVPDKSETYFDPLYMSTYQLDAEIAIVQIDGKDVFLDPGSKFCPFGLMDWRYSNNQGIRQSSTKGTEIASVPISSYNQALIQKSAKLKMTEQGEVEGTVSVAYLGIEALNRRQTGGKTDAEGQKKQLEDELKGWLPGGSEVTLTNSPDWQNFGPLIAEFKISSPFASNAGKRTIIPLHFFEMNEKAMFSSSTRSQTIYFDYPYREVDEVSITLAPGLEVESLPNNETAQIEGGALYQAKYAHNTPSTILAQRDLALASTPFPTTMYGEIKAFFDKAKAGDDQRAIIKVASNAGGH